MRLSRIERRGRWLPALAVTLAAVALTFGPDLPTLGSNVLGAEGADVPKHVWGQWWVHRSVVGGGGIPLELDVARYPDGGRFFCLDTGNGILTVPLRWFLGPVGAYNLLQMIHLSLAAMAAWALGAAVSGSRAAGLVAGIAFAFSPVLLSTAVVTGITEAAFVFPLPLIVLALLYSLRRRHWGWALAAGALSLLQAVGSWFYCVHAGIFIAGLGLSFLLTNGRPRALYHEQRVGPWVAGRIALYGAVLAAAVVPVYLAVRQTVTGDDVAYSRGASLLPGPQGLDPLLLPASGSISVADLYTLGEAGTRVDVHSLETLISSGYLGFALVAMALLGAAVAPAARPFAALAVLFAGFALGPRIYLEHDMAQARWLNPLYLAFYKSFPLFHETKHAPERFLVSAHLCMGVSASAAVAWVLGRVGQRLRWAVGAGAAGLVLAEVLLLSSLPWPIPSFPAQPTEASLALAGGEGAVVDLPFYRQSGGFEGDIFLQQVHHGRPIPFALDGVGEEIVSPGLRSNPFYRQLSRQLFGQADGGTGGCFGVDSLARSGFTEIVLRPDRLPADRAAATQATLEGCLGQPSQAGQALIYSLRHL